MLEYLFMVGYLNMVMVTFTIGSIGFTKSNSNITSCLTLNLIETAFNNLTNRVDPDQAALVRAA